MNSLALDAGRVRNELEAVELAALAERSDRLSLASDLYEIALSVSPTRANRHRISALRTALRASAGQGIDAARLDNAEKVRLRRQALEWIRAELALRTWQLKSRVSDKNDEAVRALKEWRKGLGLTSIRDEVDQDKLPEDEQNSWKALWGDVEALLDRAIADRTE